MKLKNPYYLIVAVLGLFLASCVHHQLPSLDYDFGTDLIVSQKDVSIVFVPTNLRMPPHLLINKTVRYRLTKEVAPVPFKKEITISPLMYEVSITAQVQKNGKVLREYKAQKISQTIVNQKQRVWTPGRSKLSLVVPYLKSDEEIVVTTTYSWMDIRWHDPILFEEDEPTLATKLTIDVPFGIKTHFQATNAGKIHSLAPQNIDHEKAIWGQQDNRAGLGTRFVFEHKFGENARSKPPAERLQLFFSFEPPRTSERNPAFDNWERVASFLYDRIDRYDMASNAIRDFTRKETEKKPDDVAKVLRIFSFLNNDIEKRAVMGSYLEQEIQPATKTFSKRFGSPFDIVILGKAMLTSIGLDAEIMALSSSDQNPEITNFYSPTLFYSIVLAVTVDGRTYYYDARQSFENMDVLPKDLPGSRLLTIRKAQGQFYSLPPIVDINLPTMLEEPKALEEKPSLIEEPNAPLNEEKPPVVEEPKAPVVEEKPPVVEEPKAPVIEEKPPVVEQPKAPVVEEKPPVVEQPKAPVVEEKPPVVEQPKAPVVEEKPAVVEEPKTPPVEEKPPLPEVPKVPTEEPAVIEVPTYKEQPPQIEVPPTSQIEESGPASSIADESLFEDRASILEEPTPKPEEPNAHKDTSKPQNF